MDASNPGKSLNSKVWHSLRIPITVAGVIIVYIGGWLYWLHFNPLASDERMIAHFQAHRREIERLVMSYRFKKFVPTPGIRYWGALPEVKELMQRAKVEYVDGVGPDWFPNPYSVEAAQKFDLYLKNNLRTRGLDILCPYYSVKVELQDERRSGICCSAYVLFSFGYKPIYKHLIYFPEIPKIENGILQFPVTPTPRQYVMQHHSPDRVLPSLDDYPAEWNQSGDCVYRQIEPQWFIQMCLGGH